MCAALALTAGGLAATPAAALAPSTVYYSAPSANAGPYDIALGPDGNMWFTELNAGQIGMLDARGQVSEYAPQAPSPQLIQPNSITAGPDGELWFTVTGGDMGCPQGGCASSPAPAIGTLDPSDPAAIETYPLPSTATPWAITTGPDGNLWFTDDAGNQIWTISPITHVAQPAPGRLSPKPDASEHGPTGIVAGPDGALWFTEQGQDKIGRMTTDGEVTNEYRVPTAAAAPDRIAVGADGEIYFTELGASQIGRLDPATGAIAEIRLSPGSQPNGIAPGADGAIWFTEHRSGAPGEGDAIGRFTPGGTLSEFALSDPAGVPSPTGIASGPDGNMWFADLGSDDIGQITTPPSASTGAATSAGSSSETVTGVANDHAQPGGFRIDYGTSASYGSSSANQTLAGGRGDQALLATLNGLSPATTYHCRVTAWNATGNAYADDRTFVTSPGARTEHASHVTRRSATLRGKLTANGQASSFHFQYGTTVFYGSSTGSRNAAPKDSENVSSGIGGLSAGTEYHYRLVARNSGGTTYGPDVSFKTPPAVTLGRPHVTGDGVSVAVTCHAAQDAICKGSVSALGRARRRGSKVVVLPGGAYTLTAGRAGFQVRGGKTKTVRIKLSPTGRRLLRRFKRLPVRAVVKFAGSVSETRPVTIRRG